jgi:hypothetical protein
MNQKNKWTLEIDDHYRCGDQIITRTDRMAIPPTDGDRTDIIDSNGNYHYGVTVKEFSAKFTDRISKEEYLEQTLPGLEGAEKEKAMKEIDWTPRRTEIGISVIIEIKQGKVFLKGK